MCKYISCIYWIDINILLLVIFYYFPYPFLSLSHLSLFLSLLLITSSSSVWGQLVSGFGETEMVVLLTKIVAQEWSSLILQGIIQHRLTKKEVTEVYINGRFDGTVFTSNMLGVPINLTSTYVTQILDVTTRGWSNYVKYEWPPLINPPFSFG